MKGDGLSRYVSWENEGICGSIKRFLKNWPRAKIKLKKNFYVDYADKKEINKNSK